MGEAPLILGVSGLRGIVGESLTPEVAARYAGAFGAWLIERRGSSASVFIGRDGRLGGQTIYHAAIGGLLGAGCEVVELDVVTTPTVGYMVESESADGGMIVTASHNPQEWNGLKCLVRDDGLLPMHLVDDDGDSAIDVARAPTAVEAAEIIGLFHRGPECRSNPAYKPIKNKRDAAGEHWLHVYLLQWHVLDEASQQQEKLGYRCVVDAVNSSGSTISVPFLDYLGNVIQINCVGTGVFPHTPEPTKENLSGEGGLCDAVPGLKADVGFAQDPDADRLAIVDENGGYIGEEYTLVLAALALLEARSEGEGGGEPVIVTNLSTSRMIDDVSARYGARVERTAVGEANVVERMMALRAAGEDVVLGGEGNGGVIWPEVVYVRDSLSAMALTLALMARTGKTVSELVEWVDSMAGEGTGGGGYAIVKKKVDIPSKDAARPAVEKVVAAYSGAADAAVDTQDGVRVDWAGRRAWVHVRASNTEPIMRLIAEAPTAEEAERILSAIEGVIAG